MKVCPYCEQDDLWKVAILDVDDDAVICGECDTVWMHNEDIIYGTGKNFDSLMEGIGKAADWDSIERKSKIEG